MPTAEALIILRQKISIFIVHLFFDILWAATLFGIVFTAIICVPVWACDARDIIEGGRYASQ